MATPLGFSVWRDEDGFYAPGQTADLYDGELVSIVHKVKNYLADTGKDISAIDFKIVLEQNGNPVAKHSFKLDKMTSFWLVVDPSDSDENGSFTPVFVNTFANCASGDNNFTVKLFINNELHHEGQLVYKSDGQNSIYKEILSKFEDVSGVRNQANQQHQQEYSQQLEQENAQQKAKREFQVHVNNIDSGQTKYLVEKNLSSMSENIHEILPLKTLSLSLFRGSSFELKYYNQNTSKDDASFIATVGEINHEETYTVY